MQGVTCLKSQVKKKGGEGRKHPRQQPPPTVKTFPIPHFCWMSQTARIQINVENFREKWTK
jgi:hypothetical protein